MPAVPVTIETSNTSVLMSGLEIGQQYKFSVVAKDSTGNFISLPSAFSAPVTTSTVPYPPTNFQMYVSAIDAVSFSWTAPELPPDAPTDITYTITNNRNSDTYTTSDTSYVKTGFPFINVAGTSYTFTIYATNSSGNSYYTIGAPIQVAIAPMPTITSVTFNSTGTQPTITFSLPYMPPVSADPNGNIRYYIKINGIAYGTGYYKQANFLTQTTGNTITLANGATVAGTTYTFTMYYSSSPDSPPFIITAVGLPAVPTAFTATAYDGYVGLTWTTASSSGGTIDYYTINSYLSNLSNSPVIVSCNTPNGTATSYNFSNMYGLTQGSNNYFNIRAHTEFGFSSNSSKTTAVLPGARPSIPVNGEIALVNNSNSGGIPYYVFNMAWDVPNSNGISITGYKSMATGATVNGSPFFRFVFNVNMITNSNFITFNDLDNGLINGQITNNSNYNPNDVFNFTNWFSSNCRISASNSFGYSSNSEPPIRLVTRFVLSNAGTNSNVFLAKYNAAGDTLWANRIGGTSNDTVNNILQDSLGNVFVTGRYSSSTLNISSGMDLTLSAAGSTDIFIVKYDSSGTASWSRKIVNNSVLYPTASAIDSNNNFITIGRFTQNNVKVYTNSSNFITCSNDTSYNYNRFIAKYDESGNALWSATISGSKVGGFVPFQYQEKENILTDSAGNIYVVLKTDVLNNTQPTNIYNSSNTLVDSFTTSIYSGMYVIVQYSPTGDINWSRKFEKVSPGTNDPIFSHIDSSNNLYILFHVNGIIKVFDSEGTQIQSEDTGGSYKSFCIKYDINGTPLLLPNLSVIGNSFLPFTNKPFFAFSQDSLYSLCINYRTLSLTSYSLTSSTVSWTENISLSHEFLYGNNNPFIAVDSTTSSVYLSLVSSTSSTYFVTIDGISYSTPKFPTVSISTVKYDVNGDVEWVRVLGDIGSTGKNINCITDSSGNVYVTVQVINTGLKIYDSSGNIISNVNIFYLGLTSLTPIMLTIKYNANGTPEWYKPSITTSIPTDTNTGPNNSLSVCGTFKSSVLAL